MTQDKSMVYVRPLRVLPSIFLRGNEKEHYSSFIIQPSATNACLWYEITKPMKMKADECLIPVVPKAQLWLSLSKDIYLTLISLTLLNPLKNQSQAPYHNIQRPPQYLP